MPSINILEKEVYNRIAAGEVVENPRSIVKELVENAIDAGASKITVQIEGGGLDKIVVIDNGCGIQASDVKKAFLPHATSKIKTANDIDIISTLGFRGEALPSIASVCEVTLKTISQSESIGTKIVVKGGVEQEFTACALDAGTSVEIASLFFNTPARFKFLKSARAEEGYITSAIQSLILANPTVAFRYSIDGILRYASDGTGLDGATKAVYPDQFDRLLPISAMSDGFRLEGYISSPAYSKGNRSAQTLMINGRVVTDASLSATVQNAYAERLMTRNFPLYILDIVMPFDFVDVNVHPNKSEIRLQNPRLLYSFVYRAVKETLQQQEEAQAKAIFGLPYPQIEKAETEPCKIASPDAISEVTVDLPQAQDVASSALSAVEKALRNQFDQPIKTPQLNKEDAECADISKQSIQTSNFDALYRLATGTNTSSSTVTLHSGEDQFEQIQIFLQQTTPTDTVKHNSMVDAVKSNGTETDFKTRVVGQIFSNYLIVECGEKGYLIDQHAAHERTIYDKLVQQADLEQIEQQPLLVSYIFNGSVAECEFLLSQRDVLATIGFDFDAFGNNSIKVNAIPSVLTGLNFEKFFRDLLSDMSGIRTLKNSELLKTKLSQLACKSAIKAGDVLSDKQISYFIEVFVRSGMPLFCPHGRPTVVSFDKIDLEKRFKRKL